MLDMQIENKLIDYASNKYLGIGFSKKQFVKYCSTIQEEIYWSKATSKQPMVEAYETTAQRKSATTSA